LAGAQNSFSSCCVNHTQKPAPQRAGFSFDPQRKILFPLNHSIHLQPVFPINTTIIKIIQSRDPLIWGMGEKTIGDLEKVWKKGLVQGRRKRCLLVAIDQKNQVVRALDFIAVDKVEEKDELEDTDGPFIGRRLDPKTLRL